MISAMAKARWPSLVMQPSQSPGGIPLWKNASSPTSKAGLLLTTFAKLHMRKARLPMRLTEAPMVRWLTPVIWNAASGTSFILSLSTSVSMRQLMKA